MLTLTYAYTLLHKHINTCILAGINKCVCTCACSSHTDVLKQKCILTYRVIQNLRRQADVIVTLF